MGRDRLRDYFPGFVQFLSYEFQTRRAHAWTAPADFMLDQLDQLHELGNGIHAKQRQEPAIELKNFPGHSIPCQVEQVYRLFRKSIDQACYPTLRASRDGFDDRVIDADEDTQAISGERTQSHHATDIRARFLDGVEIVVVIEKLLYLGGHKINLVGDGVVIKHAGQRSEER